MKQLLDINEVLKEYEPCIKSCTDCGTYDLVKHHCPKFCKVIKETVEEIEKEYNDGWIPCSERLPEEDGKYIVTIKNLTGHWIMKKDVFVCNYWDNDFHFKDWEDNEVIAWQPLPQPYKEVGVNNA